MVPGGRAARGIGALAGVVLLAGCSATAPPSSRPTLPPSAPPVAPPSSAPPARLVPPTGADIARLVVRGTTPVQRELALPASDTGWTVTAACAGDAGAAVRWSVSTARTAEFLIGSTLPCGAGATSDLLATPLPATRVVVRLDPVARVGDAVVVLRRG